MLFPLHLCIYGYVFILLRSCINPDQKRRLGPQNGSGSSGPEKLLKIVSYAETEKLKETMVGGQVE